MRFVYEQPMTIGKCDMGLTGNPGIKGGVCGVTYDLHGDIGVPKTAEEGDDWWLSTWEEVMDNVDGKDEPLRNLGIGETYQLNEVTDIKWVEWDVHGKPINTGHEVGVWGQGAVHSFTSASYGLTCGTLLQDQLDNVPHGVAITFHAMTTVGKPLVMKVGWQYDMTCNSLPIDTGSYVIVGQVVVVSKGVCCSLCLAYIYSNYYFLLRLMLLHSLMYSALVM